MLGDPRVKKKKHDLNALYVPVYKKLIGSLGCEAAILLGELIRKQTAYKKKGIEEMEYKRSDLEKEIFMTPSRQRKVMALLIDKGLITTTRKKCIPPRTTIDVNMREVNRLLSQNPEDIATDKRVEGLRWMASRMKSKKCVK